MIEVKERPRKRAASRRRTWRSPFAKVGVIGAGQMGSGIAHVCALPLHVLLNDISPDRIKPDRHHQRQHGAAAASASPRRAQAALSASRPTPSTPRDCDLVIEAATEKETSSAIFAQVCAVLKPEAIGRHLTSSISITRLASFDHPAGALHRHSTS
jgi:3-hydroxybutyryl-CoA dehydrogenase